MIIYPVMIPTLNRFHHFKRCVESLGQNTHANKTVLYIGLDYPPSPKYKEGWLKIKEYIPTINGFKNIILIEHKDNLGAVANWDFLVNEIKKNYDAYIATEDDNEFSPCFLDFMNKVLNKYHDNSKVISVSGFTHKGHISEKNIIASPSFTAWGVGYWFDKKAKEDINYYYKRLLSPISVLKLSFKCPQSLMLLMVMMKHTTQYGDAMSCVYEALEDKIQIVPSISMVRNWGDDGSGLHSGNQNLQSKREISSLLTITLDDISIIPTNKTFSFFKSEYYSNKPIKKHFVFYYMILKTLIYYVEFIPKLSYYYSKY